MQEECRNKFRPWPEAQRVAFGRVLLYVVVRSVKMCFQEAWSAHAVRGCKKGRNRIKKTNVVSPGLKVISARGAQIGGFGLGL